MSRVGSSTSVDGRGAPTVVPTTDELSSMDAGVSVLSRTWRSVSVHTLTSHTPSSVSHTARMCRHAQDDVPSMTGASLISATVTTMLARVSMGSSSKESVTATVKWYSGVAPSWFSTSAATVMAPVAASMANAPSTLPVGSSAYVTV